MVLLISDETTRPNLTFVESFLTIFFICSVNLILYNKPFLSSSSSINPPCVVLFKKGFVP